MIPMSPTNDGVRGDFRSGESGVRRFGHAAWGAGPKVCLELPPVCDSNRGVAPDLAGGY
jgi:hypothetical protein